MFVYSGPVHLRAHEPEQSAEQDGKVQQRTVPHPTDDRAGLLLLGVPDKEVPPYLLLQSAQEQLRLRGTSLQHRTE